MCHLAGSEPNWKFQNRKMEKTKGYRTTPGKTYSGPMASTLRYQLENHFPEILGKKYEVVVIGKLVIIHDLNVSRSETAYLMIQTLMGTMLRSLIKLIRYARPSTCCQL